MTPEQQAEALDAITTAREMVRQGNSADAITERLDSAIALLQPSRPIRAYGQDLVWERLPNGEMAWLRA